MRMRMMNVYENLSVQILPQPLCEEQKKNIYICCVTYLVFKLGA